MRSLFFELLSNWIELLGLAGGLVAGVMLGILYFSSLWWTVRSMARAGRVTGTVALIALRFVALGGLLTFVSLVGPLHLLAVTLGLFIGRSFVIRTREAV